MNKTAIEVATKIKNTLEEFERTTGKPSTIHLSNATVMLLVNEIIGGTEMERRTDTNTKKFMTKKEVEDSPEEVARKEILARQLQAKEDYDSKEEEMAAKRKIVAEHPVWKLLKKKDYSADGIIYTEKQYDELVDLLSRLNNEDKALLSRTHDSYEFSKIVEEFTKPLQARYRYMLTEKVGTAIISGYMRAEGEDELNLLLQRKFNVCEDDWQFSCSIVSG